MTFRFALRSKHGLRALLPASLVLAIAVSGAFAQRSQRTLPASVDAVYRINFTGLGDIGHFHFTSNVNGEAYTLAADAKIDTAIFDYKGKMSGSGSVPANTPRPAGYAFEYRQKTFLKKKKIKSLQIAFDGPAVSKVTFVPPEDVSAKAIPVTPEQLKNVVDPLSGVMAVSLADLAKPCALKVPIYEGKQRFDIVFAPLRRAGADHVCSVRLIPISGHKPGEGSASVISGTIEIVMRPVPKANIVIPYSVSVPTIIGTATLVSERVDITMPDQQRIALRR